MKEDKRVRWSWAFLSDFNSDNDKLYALSDRDIQTLITPLAVAQWATRWHDNQLPDENFIPTLLQRLLTPMDICQLIADCINDPDSPARAALNKWSRDTNNGGTGNPTSPIEYNPNNPSMFADTCDKDNLFAMVTGIVDLAHTSITDFAQILELSTNRNELFAQIFEAIPILGELPAGDFVSFVDTYLSNLGEGYDAAYTNVLRDTYRCDLFCLASDNCGISFEDFADYYAGRVSASIANLSWFDVINILTGGNWNGELLADSAHYLFYAALAFGSNFLGLNVPYLSRVAASLLNDSDPDWEVLCDDCPPDDDLPNCISWNALQGETWSVDFAYNPSATVIEETEIDNFFGNNLPSAKLGFAAISGTEGRNAFIDINYDNFQRVTSADFDWWYNDNGGTTTPLRGVRFEDGNGNILAFSESTASANKSEWHHHSWTGDVEGVKKIRFYFRRLGSPATFTPETTSAFLDNLCVQTEEMTEWCYEFNWTSSADGLGWSKDVGGVVQGEFLAGTGWRSERGGANNNHRIWIKYPLAAPCEITSCKIVYIVNGAGTGIARLNDVDTELDSFAISSADNAISGTDGLFFTDLPNPSTCTGEISIRLSPATNQPTEYCYLYKAVFTGNGVNPFGEDNC